MLSYKTIFKILAKTKKRMHTIKQKNIAIGLELKKNKILICFIRHDLCLLNVSHRLIKSLITWKTHGSIQFLSEGDVFTSSCKVKHC